MQLILMVLTDILILFLLVYILIRITRKESKTESTEIRVLKDSFEKLMSESEKVTKEMLSDFNKKISDLNDMLSQLDDKYNRIRFDMLKAVEISEGVNKNSIQDKSTEPYKKAVDLLALNTPVGEIKKASGLSTSEIDLIKQLTQHKAS
jgi:predicted nuclease with TOPRIM domain